MNIYNDFVDELANYEFQKIFYGKFKSSKLKFYSDSFQHCLKEVAEKRKPLLFFLHNDKVEKSNRYCELLTDPNVEDLICEKFIIMGWKINNGEEYCKNLADKILIVEELLEYLERARSAIFFIVPNRHSVKIQKTIDIDMDSVDGTENNSDISTKVLISAINVVDKLLASYNYDSFKNMTSAKYQQWMYDELGDRDYDSFEYDEHNLLQEKIQFAMYGPPKEQQDGRIDYEPKQKEESKDIFEKIKAKNNEYSKWKDRIVIAFIYNCIEPPAAEKEKKKKEKSKEDIFTPLPIFVLRKCKRSKVDKETNKQNKNEESKNNNKKNCDLSCRIFIDHIGRVYDSWDNYLAKNKLPPCKMIYPKNGKYQSNECSSEVLLEEQFSPSCGFTPKFLQVADIASGAAGILSGAALFASMFTPAAVVTVPFAIGTGIASGAYGASRSGHTLYDRGQHEESIKLDNSESRAAYLNIAAGGMSIVGAGATKIISSFVRSGSNIGASVQHTLTAINSANILISGTATVNSCYDVLQQYFEEGVAPSTLTIVQLGSSLFFFGNSVYNFQTGRTMVQEMQASTINEISDGLRSNRHRKTFNKMVKETTRVKGEVRGKAEVIATMRNSASRDEILAVLTRSNKYFNREGIRFSAERGGISLNGVQVDILEYGNMPKTQQGFILETLPPIPENSGSSYVNNTRKNVQSMRYGERVNNVFGLASFDPRSVISVLTCFSQDIQPKILRICEDFINQIDVDIIANLRDLFKTDVRVKLIQYVSDFIRRCVDRLKEMFENRLLNEEVTAVCREFGFENPRVTIYNYIERIIDQFINGDMMKQLLIDFGKWYVMLTYDNATTFERKGNREKHDTSDKVKVTCTICDGYYYKRS